MVPSKIPAALSAYFAANRPVFLTGPPAVGKSALVAQAAADAGLPLVDIRAAQMDPVDLRGLPVLEDGRTCWRVPDFLPSGPCVLFLDELPDAPKLVQSALYQLTLDRRLGDYELPAGVQIVAAGNRTTDRAAAGRLSTALASRFGHLDIDVSLADWCAWAIGAGVAPEVIAFLRFRPELLHTFDPARNSESAFPAPRTWHILSDVYQSSILPREIAGEIFAGIVGTGAGGEFAAFLRIWEDLPDIDGILLSPETAELPKNPSVCYAITGALGKRASDHTARALITYAERLGAQVSQEYELLLVRDSAARSQEFQKTRAFTTWAVKNGDLLT